MLRLILVLAVSLVSSSAFANPCPHPVSCSVVGSWISDPSHGCVGSTIGCATPYGKVAEISQDDLRALAKVTYCCNDGYIWSVDLVDGGCTAYGEACWGW